MNNILAQRLLTTKNEITIKYINEEINVFSYSYMISVLFIFSRKLFKTHKKPPELYGFSTEKKPDNSNLHYISYTGDAVGFDLFLYR